MSKYVKIITLFATILTVACTKQKEVVKSDTFKPVLLALIVKDIDRSIDWYSNVLDFKIEKEIKEYPEYGLKLAVLKAGDFHLELMEKADALPQNEALSDADSYVGGVSKIGLRVKNLDATYNHLQSIEGVDVVAGPGELPENSLPIPWPNKYLLLRDPDGNFIQFFDTGTSAHPTPWLFMLTVENLGKASFWYSKYMDFGQHQTFGEKGNRRAILERNGYVLELFEPQKVLKASEISPDNTILGFRKLAFGFKEDLTAFSSELEKKEIEIEVALEESDFEWAEKALIFKDLEGNRTQVFEIRD